MKRRPNQKPASTVSAARREAFAILLRLERGQDHADDLLRGAKVSALSAADRHLCTALVLGVLRWQIRLDATIRPLLAKPNARLDAEVRVVLRLGALQLKWMDRIPAHAAIGESVALAKAAGHTFAAGMVNAVLRKLAAQAMPLQAAAASLSAWELAEATAHPAWMVERWVANYGLEAARGICEHGQRQGELTIRLEWPELERKLIATGFKLEGGALLTAARRVVAGDLHIAEGGGIRIQDEGSQLIAELAGRGERILDCCAAPGGKTLILAERNPEAEIAACDVSAARQEAMRLRFLGSPGAARIRLMQADAVLLPAEPEYDLVLADVPCSGTGTLGRNPEIRHRLSLEEIQRQAERQRAILQAALQTLRPGGRLLYSTCSLEPEENGQVVERVLAGLTGFARLSIAERIGDLRAEGRISAEGAVLLQAMIDEDGSLTLLPGRDGENVGYDGFFAALILRETGIEASLRG